MRFATCGGWKTASNRAALSSAPNQRFVGTFSKNQLQRPHDDAFSRTGLAGDRHKARARLPLEFLDQREIADAQ